MRGVIVLGLAGLLAVPAASAWAKDEKDKKEGGGKAFKVEGKLTADDAPDKVVAGSPHKVHEYSMKAGKTYVINMISKEPKTFDPILRLEDADEKQLAVDDDGGGFPHARITFKAPKDGKYRIIATSFKATVGNYTLTVEEASAALAKLEALKSDLQTKQKELFGEFQKAKTEEDKEKIKDRFLDLAADFVAAVGKFAKENAGDPVAKEAMKVIQGSLQGLEQGHSPQVAKALRRLLEQGPKELRGEVGLALSRSLRAQYERAYQHREKEASKLVEEAETLLKGLVADHAELGDRVKDVLFELRNLTVGRPAMEIQAEDIDGKKFKLSDYRGKVVVIDFWGHW